MKAQDSSGNSGKYLSKNLFQTSKNHEETIIFHKKKIDRGINFKLRSHILLIVFLTLPTSILNKKFK